MYIWYKTVAILLSNYQKLLKLTDIWRSSNTKSLCSFFETRCTMGCYIYGSIQYFIL